MAPYQFHYESNQFMDRLDQRIELIEFLKEFAQIKIDGGGIPLEITGPHNHSEFGPLTYNVQHWILLGWLTQTFTNE